MPPKKLSTPARIRMVPKAQDVVIREEPTGWKRHLPLIGATVALLSSIVWWLKSKCGVS